MHRVPKSLLLSLSFCGPVISARVTKVARAHSPRRLRAACAGLGREPGEVREQSLSSFPHGGGAPVGLRSRGACARGSCSLELCIFIKCSVFVWIIAEHCGLSDYNADCFDKYPVIRAVLTEGVQSHIKERDALKMELFSRLSDRSNIDSSLGMALLGALHSFCPL